MCARSWGKLAWEAGTATEALEVLPSTWVTENHSIWQVLGRWRIEVKHPGLSGLQPGMEDAAHGFKRQWRWSRPVPSCAIGQERRPVGEEGTALANCFLASPFSSLGLSLLIHKMEHVASMSSKAPCTRPEHSSLAAEAPGDGMEPERRGEAVAPRPGGAWSGGGGRGEQKAVKLVLCPPPQLFLP